MAPRFLAARPDLPLQLTKIIFDIAAPERRTMTMQDLVDRFRAARPPALTDVESPLN